MRYELYKQISYKHDTIFFYILESNRFSTLLTYIENLTSDKNVKYIIIDNDTPNPVNYMQLGFDAPPSENEHYAIIYECKLAKEYYRQIKEEYYDCYRNYEITQLLSNSILATAEFQTAVYFEKYTKKAKN